MEADSENFRHMTTNRPAAINLFGAMCPNDSAAFQPSQMKATGGILIDMSETFKKRWVDRDSSSLVQVPCMQVTQVLKEHDIAHIDVFFLDVEGGELTTLQTIDFEDESIQIDIFVVEMDNTNPTKDETIRKMLQSHGYITPFSMEAECRKRKPNCHASEIFVLETVWQERNSNLAVSSG